MQVPTVCLLEYLTYLHLNLFNLSNSADYAIPVLQFMFDSCLRSVRGETYVVVIVSVDKLSLLRDGKLDTGWNILHVTSNK